ncbi:SDR family NAD(P)-dependent oxidoreductase [Pseudomonas aeruginosa]|uniref:SDR family NAD(P)-dependent oxidoreductase n=1 Tax=Pseudomonas aeruginosa TaxID=287 RepID=UPI000452B6C4|nr:SDR family NAD(P)-dependent oxidoreductase [Pseudomonas aeruginosa]KAJ10226.1 short-chain dehydrogenase [Pseudomonas aeruginosa ID4365]MDP4470273.1 SDR family NAD(P)-dependent oxidoreductase [Pseudomonas aeruginosa]MDP4476390.1 SDR family NAD(P)-dependent oxidoreductase [Pseudomonas aeruginosa]
MTIRFDGRVAIVTGAGNGLGRSHALGLAARGAKVVINDLGGARDGSGASSSAAEAVVEEIRAAGGEAFANGANVANYDEVQEMVEQARAKWGRIDILINNAGILRDATFSKGSLDDFWKVVDVHLRGTVNCTKAVWDLMREQNYGRIVLTSSASGLYGNFGQSNYGAAKAAMLGLMNVLHLEGQKNDIRVNVLAPTAATRMTEGLIPPSVASLLAPETITPGLLFLASEAAPSKVILGAGAGVFACSNLYETEGVFLHEEERTPEVIAELFDDIAETSGQIALDGATAQTLRFVHKAASALGVVLPTA